MPKVSPIQNFFSVGEISPLLYGRTDFDKYRGALKTCLNNVPLIQGPITRRPGTVYVADTKTASAVARLVHFEFSTTQAYVLEFGNLYFRMYKDRAQVISGTPVEVVTPYTTAQVPDLKFAQSADVLYIAHPAHPPAKITRTSHTTWTYTVINFKDGPYLAINATSTTMTCSATTGSVTVTASSVTGINDNAGFQTTDVGRSIRIKTAGDAYGWGKITSRISTTSVRVYLSEGVGAITATDTWRIGIYSETTGYPAAVGFYQDRLSWAGCTESPQSIQLSESSVYESHKPTDYDADATLTASAGISVTLNSSDVQAIRWIEPGSKGLLVGTVSGEWLLGPNTSNEAFSATNVRADPASNRGSANFQAVRAGDGILFTQRSKRKVRELAYVFSEDEYKSPDMTVLNEHVTYGGINSPMAWQQEPHSIIWGTRTDGVLLGFTYERDQDVIGWHRHIVGGVSDATGTDAKVESVVVIPSPTEVRDDVWMIVQRYVNGAVVRHVEYMSKFWELGDTQTDAIFLDSAVTYDSTATTTITGLDHLEGEVVSVLADGSSHPDKTVASGSITLDRSSSTVQVGYSYNSDGQTLRFEAGSADGTSQGKTQRHHRVAWRLYDTLGLKIGPDFTNLDEVIFRTTADELGEAVPLFNGDKSQTWSGGYSTEELICWRFSGPFPGTVEAIMPQLHTQDR